MTLEFLWPAGLNQPVSFWGEVETFAYATELHPSVAVPAITIARTDVSWDCHILTLSFVHPSLRRK